MINGDIYVVSKNVYGRSLLYPDCRRSRLFCELCGTETITTHMLGVIGELGFEVVERMVGNPALAVTGRMKSVDMDVHPVDQPNMTDCTCSADSLSEDHADECPLALWVVT